MTSSRNKDVLSSMKAALMMNAVQLAKDLAEGSPYFIVGMFTECNGSVSVSFTEINGHIICYSPESDCWICKKYTLLERVIPGLAFIVNLVKYQE